MESVNVKKTISDPFVNLRNSAVLIIAQPMRITLTGSAIKPQGNVSAEPNFREKIVQFLSMG